VQGLLINNFRAMLKKIISLLQMLTQK